MTLLSHGTCHLEHWGVLRAEGPDAASFLHGQLTQSVTDLQPGSVRLAGYCSAKGRLMANFVLRRPEPDTVDLLMPRDVLPALLKRLSLFKMRAKVALSESPTALFGVVGTAVPEGAVWSEQKDCIRLPDALGQARALCLGTPQEAPQEAQPTLAREAWDWLEVHAGLPWVSAATSEHFVPQMINWELLGGVNFQKGCYPGQEVVARSQYRGTVKRRAQLLLGASAPAGTEVLSAGVAVGEVVQAAQWEGQGALLAELQLAAWEGADALALPDGKPLTRAQLPYAVKAPE
jgi:tRNA-modifying protein YgfZ